MATESPRAATVADLAAVNRIIEAALNTWQLSPRVRRLALPSYLYQPHDLEHLELWMIETDDSGIVAVAAWEPADPNELPPEATSGLLLHGLYVSPEHGGRGLGTRLLELARQAAHEQGLDGLLVKAQADAAPFFRKAGLVELAIVDPRRDYPNRFWLRIECNLETA